MGLVAGAVACSGKVEPISVFIEDRSDIIIQFDLEMNCGSHTMLPILEKIH